jgi:hypothetical protein
MTGDEASLAIARALDSAVTRRLAAYAGSVRRLALGQAPDGLAHAARTLLASADPADRAAGAATSAALDPSRTADLLRAPGVEIARPAAGFLLLAPRKVAIEAARRIAVAPDRATRQSLALALAVRGVPDAVPTATLLSLMDDGGPAVFLTALVLATRDEPRLRACTNTYLESGDPWLRTHVALGLGESGSPDAIGRLERAYRFEADPAVRVAILSALSVRQEPSRLRTLRIAAKLDPDATARSVALRALGGLRLATVRSGDTVAWLSLPAGGEGTLGAISTSSQLVMPAVAAADGMLLVAGLPSGAVELRVAPGHERGKAPEGGRLGGTKERPLRR